MVAALNELKKLLQDIKNSTYTFAILTLTDYFLAMQIRLEEDGDGDGAEEGEEEGEEAEEEEEAEAEERGGTETILFLNSHNILYLCYTHALYYIIIIFSTLIIISYSCPKREINKPYKLHVTAAGTMWLYDNTTWHLL